MVSDTFVTPDSHILPILIYLCVTNFRIQRALHNITGKSGGECIRFFEIENFLILKTFNLKNFLILNFRSYHTPRFSYIPV